MTATATATGRGVRRLREVIERVAHVLADRGARERTGCRVVERAQRGEELLLLREDRVRGEGDERPSRRHSRVVRMNETPKKSDPTLSVIMAFVPV